MGTSQHIFVYTEIIWIYCTLVYVYMYEKFNIDFNVGFLALMEI
jgi:hypothetical protein